jgi:hypothetical protein
MQGQTEGNLHNNWVDTRRMYKAAMIKMLMHIYPDGDRIRDLEQTIYNRSQPHEYIECATNAETLKRVLAWRIFPDLRNRVNATIPANGIITPAQAIELFIPVG